MFVSPLASVASVTDIDFSQYDPEQPLAAMDNDSLRTTLESLTQDKSRRWTVKEILKQRTIGGLGPVLVGGPQKVADELERWVDEGTPPVLRTCRRLLRSPSAGPTDVQAW